MYESDLAYIHHVGFGSFSERAAPGLLEVLRREGVESGRVVDVGCGGGQWLRALVDAGYEAVGVEPSRTLAALARELAPGAEVVEGSAHQIDLEPCRAVTALGEVLCYFDREQAPPLAAFFDKAAAALEAGGPFIFDVIVAGPAGALDGRRWEAGTDWAVLVDVREDLEQRILQREIVTFREVSGCYRRGQETHRQSVHGIAEVEAMLAASGFSKVERLDSYGAQPMLPRRQAFLAVR